jgi:hypothetical protein
VGLVAVDTRSGVVVGTTWIGRDAERPNALIVGRHSMCDLVVSDPEVSLRHIAVLSPVGDARLAEFSLHDLHTAQGFTLEEGESVLAAAVSRFGVVRFGLYSLFCFATGLEAWSESAADVWVELGGETKTVHHEPKSGRAKERPKPDDRWQVGSLVSVIQGPLRTSDALVGPDEEQVAELRVRAGERLDRMALGSSALKRGVLVGRSDRCASVLTASIISRVHVLVIEIDGEVVGVDTASTGGTFRDREATVQARVVMLSRGERAALVNEHSSVSVR